MTSHTGSLISARGLGKRFGSVVALDDLTLDVEPGVVGLIGANGAGKSTLLKILLGLLAPSAGTARVLGLDVVREGRTVRERVGYMPEHDCLPPDVAATEFVVHMACMSGLPRAAARERAADTLRHVGLHEERYRAMGEYSTGMRQRVKLAQALVHDPSVVLLDEPTNGLDPAGRDEMLGLIQRVHADFGIPVVVTSHLLGELERICDSVVVIEGGRLTRHETTAAVTARAGTLIVEVEGDPGVLMAELVGAGISAHADGRLVEVSADDARAYDVIRDAVADHDLGLLRMEPRRHRMVELFTETREGAEPHGD
jgi:ABC-2 type transport system ATP-binding protein